MNANVRQQLFTQEALMKNTYKIMKKTNPHPSCKPSNDRKHHKMPRMILHKSSASLPRAKYQDKRQKYVSHKRVSYVMIKMRGNVLYLYQSHDL